MTMIYRSPDGSFIIHDRTPGTPTPKCHHVQPGVVDFPGRCVKDPGHQGRHEGGLSYIGYPQNPPLPPETWDDDE